MKKFITFFAFFTLLIPTLVFAQREEILNFTSNIVVNRNASIDVTEIITVHANQDRILRGIVRRLPTRYMDSYGIKRKTTYQLKNILFNNQPSSYHTEFSNNQFAVYIGQLDVVLTPGDYTYTIQYHVNNAVNFLKDADELYWNITGNEWDFPIRKATATIELPEGAKILRYAAYTGKAGERNQAFTANESAANKISFVTTTPFNSGEGLTIAVSWPKGIVIAPTWKEKVKTEIEDERGNYIALEITGLLLLYFLIVWYYRGRDPKKGTIIPLFEPPTNLSPGAMRYINNMGTDAKTFTASITSMAVKGAITIDNQQGVFSLHKQNDVPTLAEEEAAIARKLFANSPSITFNQEASDKLLFTRALFNKSLRQQFYNTYFVTNFRYLIPAFFIALLAIISAISTFSSQIMQSLIIMLSSGVMISASIILILKRLPIFRMLYHDPSFKNFTSTAGSLFTVFLFALLGVVSTIVLLSFVSLFTAALLFLLIACMIIFQKLLKAPTPQGRQILDEIEGFKLFLTTTEQDRLNKLTPVNVTPETFEKYLPYAIALNIENEWGEKFNALLQKAGIDVQSYKPSWYTGAVWTGTTAGTFPLFLDSGLTSAYSSISSESSASSGSSGSSGGGSGGGGGGGW